MKTAVIKGMKASWYQGINEQHYIAQNTPIQMDHVLVLIMYSNLSDLCFDFRATYRKINENESNEDQCLRHSQFAYFGRYMYESFVFYGTTDTKIKMLYHGINKEIFFKTMYCTFDAPTSMT
eukprot:147555_1